jgi:hypothetical protein
MEQLSSRNPYQGETIYYIAPIAGAESITGTGILRYYKGDDTPVDKAGTLTAGVFTTTFGADETQDMIGTYNIEVKIKDSANNDLGLAVKSTMTIQPSSLKAWGI